MNSTLDSFYSRLEGHWRILHTDQYSHNLPLVHSPMPTIIICNLYLLFVFKLGPAFMKSRPAYDLKPIMLVYNFIQVILNSYAALYGYYVFLFIRPVNIGCIPILPNDHELKQREVYLSYLFYLLKFFDLTDTIFFTLRKKQSQVTFLHVYHHYVTSILGIIYLKYVGFGGHAMIFGICNTTVHSVMYLYYFLSACSPKLRGTLWWKRYITKMQIAQFVILVIHNTWPFIFETDCSHPKWLLLLAISQFGLMIVLFTRFYRQAYLTKKPAIVSGVKDFSTSKLLTNGAEKLD